MRRRAPPPPGTRVCPQCWVPKKWPEKFIGKLGRPVLRCRDCQARYAGWSDLSPEQRAARRRTDRVPDLGELRASLVLRSGNKKLGGIPASVTSRSSCPPTCAWYADACYALHHVMAQHWRRVGESGDSWGEFCAAVSMLPAGALWRHNEAGDLPGDGVRIDPEKFGRLVGASYGRRGFTFTHYRVTDPHNREMLRLASGWGFVVNASTDSLADADAACDAIGGLDVPVTTVLPSDTPDRGTRTPGGRRVIVCPNETTGISCADCQLCAHPFRKAIVGFRAHGSGKVYANAKLRLPVVA